MSNRKVLDHFISLVKDETGAGVVKLSEPLSSHTTMGIGGPADVFAAPRNGDEFMKIAKTALEFEMPLKVIGAASNLLVPDDGYRGLVVTTKSAFQTIEIDGLTVTAGSGATLGQILSQCRMHGLSGLEALSGIPGTLGGALYMNASAYGTEISEFVEKASVLSKKDLSRVELAAESMSFSYRSGAFTQESIIESSVLRLNEDDPLAIANRIDEYVERRRSTQPIWDKSAGCIFKNPEGTGAGRLIDRAGLKGLRVGGAVVSNVHANFIVNAGGASFSDVRGLIDIIREKVQDAFGTELELEVEILQ